jgi:superfamily I DNA/RNA helicase
MDSCVEGAKPQLVITNGHIDKQNAYITNEIIQPLTEDEYNIGILTPLARYSQVELNAIYYFNFLAQQFNCSYYDHTQHNCTGLTAMKNIHITPFKSAKGLEFDAVIIPCFDTLMRINDFYAINWKDFFVGVTRAKSRLFLFSNNDIPQYGEYVERIFLSNDTTNSTKDDLPF